MAAERTCSIQRKTRETNIHLTLNLDGEGRWDLDTGVPFMDHMLSHMAKHGLFDLAITCEGDIEVDAHHSVEDVGIVLGQALAEALGDKAGISRYGHQILPMDEALVLVALDFSGRSLLVYDAPLPSPRVGDFDTELVPEFLQALARHAGLTLHVKLFHGENTHHIVEAIFKGLGRALRQAASRDSGRDDVPSTKGAL